MYAFEKDATFVRRTEEPNGVTLKVTPLIVKNGN